MRTRPLVLTLCRAVRRADRGIGASVPAAAVLADYIVVLEDSVANPAQAAAAAGVMPTHVYRHALKGYAAPMSAAKAAAIAARPNVRFVEPDGIATISATQSPCDVGPGPHRPAEPAALQLVHVQRTGAGVKAYIIDTGMRLTHVDYGGRAISGFDFIDNDPNASDCHGHGTHVGGTVGSTTYGVAKGVTLVAVRVLNCQGSGTYSQVIAGVDWVTGNHLAGQPAVANMSLGGGVQRQALDDRRARTRSPTACRTPSQPATTTRTRATTRRRARRTRSRSARRASTDARASFSNFGCVPRRVCAGRQHHVDGQQLRHMLPGRMERHVDGLAARGGCGRAVPPGQPVGRRRRR